MEYRLHFLPRRAFDDMSVLPAQPLLVLDLVPGQLLEHLPAPDVSRVVGRNRVELHAGLLGQDCFFEAGNELFSGLAHVCSLEDVRPARSSEILTSRT